MSSNLGPLSDAFYPYSHPRGPRPRSGARLLELILHYFVCLQPQLHSRPLHVLIRGPACSKTVQLIMSVSWNPEILVALRHFMCYILLLKIICTNVGHKQNYRALD